MSRGSDSQLSNPWLRAVWGLWSVWVLLLPFMTWNYDRPDGWAVTGWLINWEGGFVRRGLPGQILLEIWRVWPYDLTIAAAVLYLVPLYIFTLLLVRRLWLRGWSPAALLAYTGLAGAYYLAYYPARDWWVILLLWGAFVSLRNWQWRGAGARWGVLFFASFMLAEMFHEAAFFYGYPLCAVALWYRERRRGIPGGRAVWRVAWLTMPVLLLTAVLGAFSGSPQAAQAIWESWLPAFDKVITPPVTRNVTDVLFHNAIGGVGWDMRYVANHHWTENFLIPFCRGVPSWPITVACWVVQWFLLTRCSQVRLLPAPFDSEAKPFPRALCGAMAAIVFVGMVPLWVFFSCDYLRLFTLWTAITFMALDCFADCLELPAWERGAASVNARMDRLRPFSNPWFYTLVAFLIPVGTFGGSRLDNYFAFLRVRDYSEWLWKVYDWLQTCF